MGLFDKEGQSRAYFDRIASDYDALPNLQVTKDTFPSFISAIEDVAISNAEDLESIRMIDVGCGTGELLDCVHRLLPEASLMGTDISEAMLYEARKKIDPDIDLAIADCCDLPVPAASCDVVMCNHSFHHYPHPLKAVREFRRVLKPDGVLLIGENRMSLWVRLRCNLYRHHKKRMGDVWFYSEPELTWVLRRQFDDVRYEDIDGRSCFVSARSTQGGDV